MLRLIVVCLMALLLTSCLVEDRRDHCDKWGHWR